MTRYLISCRDETGAWPHHEIKAVDLADARRQAVAYVDGSINRCDYEHDEAEPTDAFEIKVDVAIYEDRDDEETWGEPVAEFSHTYREAGVLDGPDAEVLAEETTGEFSALQVIRLGRDFYRRDVNGGSRGAHSWGGDRIPDVLSCEAVSETEAKRMMLELGMSPREIARKLDA